MNIAQQVEISVYDTGSRSSIYFRKLDDALDAAHSLIACKGIDEVRVITADNQIVCVLYRGMRAWLRKHVSVGGEE